MSGEGSRCSRPLHPTCSVGVRQGIVMQSHRYPVWRLVSWHSSAAGMHPTMHICYWGVLVTEMQHVARDSSFLTACCDRWSCQRRHVEPPTEPKAQAFYADPQCQDVFQNFLVRRFQTWPSAWHGQALHAHCDDAMPQLPPLHDWDCTCTEPVLPATAIRC